MTAVTSPSSGGSHQIVGRYPDAKAPHQGLRRGRCGPASRLVSNHPVYQQLHRGCSDEWHALLTTGYVELAERSLHTIVIPSSLPAGISLTQAWAHNWPLWSDVGFTRTTKATIHVVADGLPPKLAELAARSPPSPVWSAVDE